MFIEVISDVVGLDPSSATAEIIAGLSYLVILTIIVSCFFSALFSLFRR